MTTTKKDLADKVEQVTARRKTHFKPGKLLKEALHKPLDK